MTAQLTDIARYPIKGIGCEALQSVTLQPASPLPGDRAWALLHRNAADSDDWQPRGNFLVVAHGPNLAPIVARSHSDGSLTLTHPRRAPLRFQPRAEGGRLMDWLGDLWPETQPAARRLVRAPAQGMADNGVAQLSIMTHASLRDLSQQVGQDLDPRRFRGNLWLDGLAPWAEFDLVGHHIRIGQVELHVTDRIERCRATEANPETGERDVQTVRALHQHWGHRDFGIYATVTQGGTLTPGDRLEIL